MARVTIDFTFHLEEIAFYLALQARAAWHFPYLYLGLPWLRIYGKDMNSLTSLTERIVAFRDERDWKQFHKPKDMVLSLMMEAAELAEHVQWKTDAEISVRIEERKEAVGEELADVLYWTLLIAHDCGINLEDAFHRKMKSNAQKYPIAKAKGSHSKYTELP